MIEVGGEVPENKELLRWRCVAEFVDGPEKRNVMELLCRSKSGADYALSLMRNVVCAEKKYALHVLIRMAEDLLAMSYEDVANKPYKFVLEKFYWADADEIPQNDPHWQVIPLQIEGKLLSENSGSA